jgi:L,D-transpeptidase catalytic domain
MHGSAGATQPARDRDDSSKRLSPDRWVRRLEVLALGLSMLSVACHSAAVSWEPVPTSPQTFAVTDLDLRPGLEPRLQGDLVVASKTGPFRVFRSPWADAGARPYRAENDWGQQLWLPVIRQRIVALHRWFHVRLAERPNGSEGWLRARDVDTGTVQDRIVVRLRHHTLTRYDDGEPVERFMVAIGKPSTPTTTGRFFVWARVGYRDTDGPYGNFALGLSGFSEVITDWPGGGRMAIHGTSAPNLAGRNVSNGCVRVFNPLMATLIEVPIGTTVIIRP